MNFFWDIFQFKVRNKETFYPQEFLDFIATKSEFFLNRKFQSFPSKIFLILKFLSIKIIKIQLIFNRERNRT